MRSIVISIFAGSLLAVAQTPGYILTDLGPVGGGYGGAYVINKHGLVTGAATMADGSSHAVLWYNGWRADISSPGIGGQNSNAFSASSRGAVVGVTETSKPDPHSEDFCGFKLLGLTSQSNTCVPFLWQKGVMTQLETLGGNNGAANSVNSRGEAAGIAETTAPDPTCPPPNVFQFKPVIWRIGSIQQLPTFPGDPDGSAYMINENGQAAGASGDCTPFNPQFQVPLHPLHALLWQNGVATDLGNLGGTGQFNGNLAIGLNNLGHVVGTSDVRGDKASHAFLWTRETGMKDLGTLPGDLLSGGVSVNDNDEVVGISLDANFNPRAYHWQNGVMKDLNTLIPANSGLFLLSASSINSSGEIVGAAVDMKTGEPHAFLATPAPDLFSGENPSPETRELSRPVLSEEVRILVQQAARFGQFGGRQIGPR